MLKILEISGYPPPHGGWSVRTEQLKKRLDAEGHSCVVLNTGASRRVPSPHYETVENAWVYVTKVWRFCGRGYLAHTHANGEAVKGIALAIVAQIIARLVGVGSVLTFHAGTEQVIFPRRKAPAWAPLFRLLFALPTRIVCNSDDVKARILEYGVPSAKVVPIPAFSRQYLDFTPAALPTHLDAHFTQWPRTLFCYLALRPVYYPEVLFEAFRAIAATDRSLGLILCGVGSHADDAVAESFQRSIRDPQLAPRLCCVDNLTHDQFLTAMTRSLMYVRTHLSDGVCSSVLEALTLGVPVVACQNGTRPEGVITYSPEDADALAAAIVSVLRASPGERSRSRVEVPDTVRTEIDLLASVATASADGDAVAA